MPSKAEHCHAPCLQPGHPLRGTARPDLASQPHSSSTGSGMGQRGLHRTHQRAELHHQQVRGDFGALGQALQEVGVLESPVRGKATGACWHHSRLGLGEQWQPLGNRLPASSAAALGASAGTAGSAGSGYQHVPAPQDMLQRDICSALLGQGAAPCLPLGPTLPMTSPQPAALPPRHGQRLPAQPSFCRNEPQADGQRGRDRAVLPGELGWAPPWGSSSSARQPKMARRGPGAIHQHPPSWLCPVQQQHGGVTPAVPVGLRFLQELHLVLHAGARLQLLHHHLGAADARVHLPQEHLGQGTGSSPPSSPCTPSSPQTPSRTAPAPRPVSHRGIPGGPCPCRSPCRTSRARSPSGRAGSAAPGPPT